MSKILDTRIDEIINNNYLQYGEYIIKNRALPDIRDGLKPVYRRILYALHVHKCNSFTKSATCAGYVFPYHPHGSTYSTMVGLVQEDNNLTPLLVGKGNFGQHTSRDLAPAAERYSEIKLSNISKDIFKNLNKDIVKWVPNYDGTLEIPEVLPVKFPLVLHIAQEGIALGMSSRIPSFNINELCNSMIKYLENGEEDILVPDFATGASIIKDNEVFRKVNYEGKGSIKIRAKAKIINNIIEITEIPYSTTREKIIESIISLIKDKKITDIIDVKDLTGLTGLKIEVTCKKNSNVENILERLYEMTTLEDTYSCNMNVLVNGLPRVMGVWEIIKEWIAWRDNCLAELKKGENKKLEEEVHLLKGLESVIDEIDKIIEVIRFSEKSEITQNLCSVFGLDENQALYIRKMPLENINQGYFEEKANKIKELEKLISNNIEFMNDYNIRNKVIIEDLNNIKDKFGKDRKSNIIEIDRNIVKEKKVEIIEDYDINVFITEENYIKKVKNMTSKANKLKNGDSIKHHFKVRNSDEIIVFSGTNAYKIYLRDIKDHNLNELGEYIPNVIGENNIAGYSIISKDYKFHIVLYSDGKISKIDLESFKTSTKRKKLSNSLRKGFDVISITPLKEDCDFTVVNDKYKMKDLNTKVLDLKSSRASQGSTLWKNIIEIIF